MQGRKEEAIELDEVKIIIPEGKEEVSEPPSTDGYFATIPDPIVAEIITYLSFQEAASFQTNKRLKNIIYNAPINQNVDISSARENKVTRKGTYQEVLHALSYYKEEEKKIQRFKEDISNKGNAKCGGDSVTVPGTICSIGAGLIVWSGATVGYLNSLSSVKAILAGGIYGVVAMGLGIGVTLFCGKKVAKENLEESIEDQAALHKLELEHSKKPNPLT